MTHLEDGITRFFDRYAAPRSDAARRVEEDTLGEDVGLTGYTTIDQARALAEHLDLQPGHRLLDVGAGRGWPGLLLAAESGCRLVSTDVPKDALVQARGSRRGLQVRKRARWAVADARELPFGSGYFDSVVHADVLC